MVYLVDLLVITFLKSAYDIFPFQNCYTICIFLFVRCKICKTVVTD